MSLEGLRAIEPKYSKLEHEAFSLATGPISLATGLKNHGLGKTFFQHDTCTLGVHLGQMQPFYVLNFKKMHFRGPSPFFKRDKNIIRYID